VEYRCAEERAGRPLTPFPRWEKERIVKAINDTRKLLNIPSDYLVGILPASDTGAFECAMWSLLGPTPVTVLVWESFSEGWATDVKKQLNSTHGY